MKVPRHQEPLLACPRCGNMAHQQYPWRVDTQVTSAEVPADELEIGAFVRLQCGTCKLAWDEVLTSRASVNETPARGGDGGA
jgi:hypothetical protein